MSELGRRGAKAVHTAQQFPDALLCAESATEKWAARRRGPSGATLPSFASLTTRASNTAEDRWAKRRVDRAEGAVGQDGSRARYPRPTAELR